VEGVPGAYPHAKLHGCGFKNVPILAILWTVLPHYLTHNDEIWLEGANLELPPPSQIL